MTINPKQMTLKSHSDSTPMHKTLVTLVDDVIFTRPLVLFPPLHQRPTQPFPVVPNQHRRDGTLVRSDKTDPLSIAPGISSRETTREVAWNMKNDSKLEARELFLTHSVSLLML